MCIYLKGIYKSFNRVWSQEIRNYNLQNPSENDGKASLARTIIFAFGQPFMLAGLNIHINNNKFIINIIIHVHIGILKLIHDSCLFAGPLLLNQIIHYLKDPNQSIYTGLFYVCMHFVANVLMSLCLRQYFFWCFRVGMRLRLACAYLCWRI